VGTSIDAGSRPASLAALLIVPVLLGLLAAVLQSFVKLRLGIPGHAAILWLVPVLAARFLSPLTLATSVATTTTALSMYGFSGFSIRWPVVLTFGTFWLVGPVLDLMAQFARNRTGWQPGRAVSRVRALLALAAAGVACNLAHLGLKLGFGVMRPHVPKFGLPSYVYELVTYVVFGLAAGVLTFLIVCARCGSKGETA
jgi:hypothetical protein